LASDQRRLEQLTLAASFCLFDKKLRSSGNGSIVWGLLNLLLGGVVIAEHSKWGAVSLVLGLALIAAGVYERKVRDPKVIIISATTLAGLALWNFTLIGLAAMGKMQLALVAGLCIGPSPKRGAPTRHGPRTAPIKCFWKNPIL
jgi:hypothetical protein